MAKLSSKDRDITLKDGAVMIAAAEALGVPMGCFMGVCGACKVKIISGAENLGPLTQTERDWELKPGFRLACQAKIKKGNVKIKF